MAKQILLSYIYKLRNKVKILYKERKVGNRGGKGYILLLSYQVNRYHTIHKIYNSTRTRLLSFLPYSAYYSNIQTMCSNVWQYAIYYYTQCSAIFCQGSAIFCQGQIVQSRWNAVETGSRIQGITGQSHNLRNCLLLVLYLYNKLLQIFTILSLIRNL